MVFRPPMLLNPPVNPGSIDYMFPPQQTGQDLVNQAIGNTGPVSPYAAEAESLKQQRAAIEAATGQTVEEGLRGYAPRGMELARKNLPYGGSWGNPGEEGKKWLQTMDEMGLNPDERRELNRAFSGMSESEQRQVFTAIPMLAKFLQPSTISALRERDFFSLDDNENETILEEIDLRPPKKKSRRSKGSRSAKAGYSELDDLISWIDSLQGGEGASQQRRQRPVGQRGAPEPIGIQMDPSRLGSPRQIESLPPEEEGPEDIDWGEGLEASMTEEPSMLGSLGIGGAGAALLALLLTAGMGGKKRKKRRYRITPGGVKKYY